MAPSGLQLGLAASGLGRALRRAPHRCSSACASGPSVCLAFYIAFWLELDNAYWAAHLRRHRLSASLGASLRKGWFRLVGTVVGAIVIVALTAAFPADSGSLPPRPGALVRWLAGLSPRCCAIRAVFGGARRLHRGHHRQRRARRGGGCERRAGLHAGRDPRQRDLIGIVCAGWSWPGRISAARGAVGCGLLRSQPTSPESSLTPCNWSVRRNPQTRALRRDFLRRVIALDPAIDEAQGEVADLRYHSPVLQGAMRLFAALSSWQMAALHLELMPANEGRSKPRGPPKSATVAGATWPARRGSPPAAGLRGGGARAHRSAGRGTSLRNAGRPGGGDARRNLAGSGGARPAHRRARGMARREGGVRFAYPTGHHAS